MCIKKLYDLVTPDSELKYIAMDILDRIRSDNASIDNSKYSFVYDTTFY